MNAKTINEACLDWASWILQTAASWQFQFYHLAQLNYGLLGRWNYWPHVCQWLSESMWACLNYSQEEFHMILSPDNFLMDSAPNFKESSDMYSLVSQVSIRYCCGVIHLFISEGLRLITIFGFKMKNPESRLVWSVLSRFTCQIFVKLFWIWISSDSTAFLQVHLVVLHMAFGTMEPSFGLSGISVLHFRVHNEVWSLSVVLEEYSRTMFLDKKSLMQKSQLQKAGKVVQGSFTPFSMEFATVSSSPCCCTTLPIISQQLEKHLQASSACAAVVL